MKLLIFGANGQVGGHLIQQLKSKKKIKEFQKFEVLAVTRNDLDLSNSEAIIPFLKLHSPNWIINASAYTEVDKAESESKQAFLINEEAVKKIAIYCNDYGARLVHISTDYVFDGNGNLYTEECNVRPIGVYGSSKLAGEAAIKAELQQNIILRTSWIFGHTGTNFVKTMISLAASRKELSVIDDQIGSPTSAKAVASSIILMFSKMVNAKNNDPRWGTYHFSGFPFVSWAEFAEEIFSQANSKGIINTTPKVSKISSDEYPALVKRPLNSCLDSSKICYFFEIHPDDWKVSLGYVLDEIKGLQAV
jgi:dTDP-4-dehydrorhamnose reductase